MVSKVYSQGGRDDRRRQATTGGKVAWYETSLAIYGDNARPLWASPKEAKGGESSPRCPERCLQIVLAIVFSLLSALNARGCKGAPFGWSRGSARGARRRGGAFLLVYGAFVPSA